jgi:tRNA (mo5U34)-methyltransferase
VTAEIRTDKEGRVATPRVDALPDGDLKALNEMLPWQCFTLDGQGRRFGKPASLVKRNSPQAIPDRRIVELDRRIPLAGLHVLEIGCFEAIHTIALVDRGARVTAVDSRIENVVKTVTRLWGFGLHADVFQCDVEKADEFARVPEVDVTHHVGVLYHLADPVRHLRAVAARTRRAIMLDTHYAAPAEATQAYEVDGQRFAYKRFGEHGRKAAFAGMYDHAKWLPLDTLTSLLREGGFTNVDVAQLRDERNGPRTLIYATRD